jgi:phospholipase D1/2
MEPSSRLSRRVNQLTRYEIFAESVKIFHKGVLKDTSEVPKYADRELLYCFKITANIYDKSFSWDVIRTYYEFADLQGVIQAIKFKHTNPPRLVSWGNLRKLPIPDKLARISDFFTALSNDPDFSSTQPVLEFLEISFLSFEGVVKKRKEGFVFKRTGGRTANEKHFFNCTKYIRRYQKRWLVIRENLVGYLASNTQENLHEALLYKGKFMVLSGHRDTGFRDGVKIVTAQREFIFRTGSEFKRMEWVQAINQAYNESDWKLHSNPFGSSFPVRSNNKVTWFVDAADYFEDVYETLLTARNTVYISDWWLSPELYLRRPANEFPESQIKVVLRDLAARGVMVYVTLYKEVELALTLNSLHTKKTLEALHPKIKVLRHPQRSLVGGEFLWSHHEKVVVIDQEVAFMGGLDLCYGRMDNPEHLLVDTGVSQFWNGIDYSNSRIADFTNVEDWQRDSIDRTSVPRMPWHDIALKVTGRAAVDLGLHFIELWNHITLDITGNYHKKKAVLEPTLTLAEETKAEFKPAEAKSDVPQQSPFIETFKKMLIGTSKNIDLDNLKSQVYKGVTEDHALPAHLHQPQVRESRVMSVQTSRPDVNQASQALTASLGSSDAKTALANMLVQRVLKPSADNATKKSLIDELHRREQEEEVKEQEELKRRAELNEDDLARDMLIPVIKNSPNKSGDCRCQVLRSAGTWSFGLDETEMSVFTAYLELIDKAKNFIYIENQFFISNTAGDVVKNSIAQALVDRIKAAVKKGEKFKVIVVMPLLPAFEGSIDDEAAAVLRVQLFWEYQTICRGPTSLYTQLAAEIDSPEQYISFFGLRTHGVLGEMPVTEIIYVHSKLMIVDDDFVIMGSANINDRSMLGRNDSELAVRTRQMLIEDDEKVQSTMAGQAVSVSKFAYSLRMTIFKEHSGCHDESALRDPFSTDFDQVWDASAKVRVIQNNTLLYRHVFRCYPDDEVSTLGELNTSQAVITDYALLRDSVRGNLVSNS